MNKLETAAKVSNVLIVVSFAVLLCMAISEFGLVRGVGVFVAVAALYGLVTWYIDQR